MMVWNLYLLLHVSRFGLKFQRCILDIMAAFRILVMKFHPGEFEGDYPKFDKHILLQLGGERHQMCFFA